MVFTDAKEADHPLVFANDSFLSLAGYDREEVLGQSFDFLMGRPVDPRALAQVEAAFAGSAENEFEIRFRRKDGSMFWAALFISPILDKTGNVVQHFASFVDLSKHKQEEDRLRFLLGELNHRTQNTLATCRQLPCRPCAARRTRKSLTPSRGEFWRFQRPIACWAASIGRQ